jgi:hypothetical protein
LAPAIADQNSALCVRDTVSNGNHRVAAMEIGAFAGRLIDEAVRTGVIKGAREAYQGQYRHASIELVDDGVDRVSPGFACPAEERSGAGRGLPLSKVGGKRCEIGPVGFGWLTIVAEGAQHGQKKRTVGRRPARAALRVEESVFARQRHPIRHARRRARRWPRTRGRSGVVPGPGSAQKGAAGRF